jgi:hypothetical protein
MQIKGIKRGNIIEILENSNIPDGSEVLIEVREVSPVNNEEKLAKMKEFLAGLSDEDREEWGKIGEFLDSERAINRQLSVQYHKTQGRSPLFGSDRGLITTSDDFDDPLELLPSPLVDRLLKKAKELTKVSAEISEIIAKIEKERQSDRPHYFWEAVQKFRQ